MSDPLSSDCETRARARAWIEKFDAADGRYLSRKKRELAAVVTASKNQYLPSETFADGLRESEAQNYNDLEIWLIARALVNGIPWTPRIRSKAVDCQIGDFFRNYPDPLIVPPGCDFIRIVAPLDHAEFRNREELEACSMTDIRVFIFKRMTFNLWQRVE